jgi:hypothetical protein
MKELLKLRDTFPKGSPEHTQAKAEIRRRWIIFMIVIVFITAFADIAFRYIVAMSK